MVFTGQRIQSKRELMMHVRRIIGVGNEFRRDDGVGIFVVREIKEKHIPSVEFLELSGEGATLIASWEHAEHVIIIDATRSGTSPGQLIRFDVHTERIPQKMFHCSSHSYGVAEAIETARILKKLPPEFMIYGIEGGNFGMGIGLTPQVEETAHRLSWQILETLFCPFFIERVKNRGIESLR